MGGFPMDVFMYYHSLILLSGDVTVNPGPLKLGLPIVVPLEIRAHYLHRKLKVIDKMSLV